MVFIAALVALAVGLLAQEGPGEEEGERRVERSQVPAAAMETLERLAAGSPITALAEEKEHGHVYYEGSWSGAGGNVDGLVTADGEVIEIEESVSRDQVPAAVRRTIAKEAGDAEVRYERKTVYVFEAHFKKGGHPRELMATPEGRRYREAGGD